VTRISPERESGWLRAHGARRLAASWKAAAPWEVDLFVGAFRRELRAVLARLDRPHDWREAAELLRRKAEREHGPGVARTQVPVSGGPGPPRKGRPR
jgi:hypothetical protein